MATSAGVAARAPRSKSLAPDTYERVLAWIAAALLTAVAVALVKGRPEWHEVPQTIWLHIATIAVALALTPVMLLGRRGTRLHRRLGWVWVAAMAITAASTFFIRTIDPGRLWFIHILSAWTLIQVPLLVLRARRHEHDKHRASVRGMVTGALIVAGIFTFPYDRLMGSWLFG